MHAESIGVTRCGQELRRERTKSTGLELKASAEVCGSLKMYVTIQHYFILFLFNDNYRSFIEICYYEICSLISCHYSI